MTLRVLIADDEPLAVERLQALLADVEGVAFVGAARDGAEAAAMIEDLRPDLALLDIRMPRQSGMALARSLAGGDTEVAFVTAFDHFAAEAFEVDALDYLLKPVERSRLEATLRRAERRRGGRTPGPPPADASRSAAFWAPGRHGLVRVPADSVDWIEAARDYVLLHTAARSYILRATMDGVQSQLDPALAVRISRSAIVRRDAVAEVVRQGRNGLLVVLKDGVALKVGATYAPRVRTWL